MNMMMYQNHIDCIKKARDDVGKCIVWARRAHNKTVVASQGASTDSRFKEEKLWLELSEGDENWHER